MRKIVFILLFFNYLWAFSQIKDTIFGKPKYVKESVQFLTKYKNYKLFYNDSDYGHAVIFSPDTARNRFTTFWFESDYCGYINNETFYDEKGRISKEIWFQKNEKLESVYLYTYDDKGRLKKEVEQNRYVTYISDYVYKKGKDGYEYIDRKIIDSETQKLKHRRRNYSEFKPKIREYDDAKREERTYFFIESENDENVYHKKLDVIKTFDEHNKVIEIKRFGFHNDFDKIKEHRKLQYNDNGQLLRECYFSEELENYCRKYHYTQKGFLKRKESHYNDKLSESFVYEYEGDYIVGLEYYDSWRDEENKKSEPSIVKYRYKFDKHKNWTEIVKNVNGVDLYIWKRKIKYY